jgi:hypothetical protein
MFCIIIVLTLQYLHELHRKHGIHAKAYITIHDINEKYDLTENDIIY